MADQLNEIAKPCFSCAASGACGVKDKLQRDNRLSLPCTEFCVLISSAARTGDYWSKLLGR